MFDLTRNIKLDAKWQKRYLISRFFLYDFFLVAIVFVADRVLFPTVTLGFSFINANSLKNTIISPRTQAKPISKGAISTTDSFLFNANPQGHFSDATINLTLNKKSDPIKNGLVEIRKSYRAFFYPDGNAVAFKNGSLLNRGEDFYIVSNGKVRKFIASDVFQRLGFSKESFLKVTDNELKFNALGDEIISADSYPDDTIFMINGIYYQLKNQQLLPFISKRAFLSQYNEILAINKNSDFLSLYPVSEIYLGFADGTLASSNESVFILSKGKSYPIDNADTFNAMGYNWDDVIALESDELGAYERQKQFTNSQPHPDGTIFLDQKTNSYFLINNGQKLPFKSFEVLKTYLVHTPITADQQSLEKKANCDLKNSTLSSNSYSCTFPLAEIINLPGNDYQFNAKFGSESIMSNLEVTYFTPLNISNLMTSLSSIKQSLKNNYIQR